MYLVAVTFAVVVLVIIIAAVRYFAITAKQLLRGNYSAVKIAPRRTRALAAPPPKFLSQKVYQLYIDKLIASAAADFGPPGTPLARGAAIALAGGKRLRPTIIMLIASEANCSAVAGAPDTREAALFIEYIHAASLIIDDLPCFDNDVVRRGQPSVHAALGEAVAQMTSVSLSAAALQCICRQTDWNRAAGVGDPEEIMSHIMSIYATEFGATGAAGGQLADVAITGKPVVADQSSTPLTDQSVALKIARDKTATFFIMAFAVGWLCGGGDPARLAEVRQAGEHFGIMYQIADDLRDFDSDKAKGSQNYAIAHGKPGAWKAVNDYWAVCRQTLERLGVRSEIWGRIFVDVTGRTVE
jgi:geranylgeranyl diphosphate synthase type II